jgi:hypothetical protein
MVDHGFSLPTVQEVTMRIDAQATAEPDESYFVRFAPEDASRFGEQSARMREKAWGFPDPADDTRTVLSLELRHAQP